jgi:glutamyl-tRNA synthetase
MKERATFVGDIYTEGQYLFENPAEFDKKTVNKKWKEEAEELMKEWSQELAAIESFDAANIEISFKSFLEKKEMGIGKVLPLIRLVLTGKGMGPSMFEIAALIGKEESLSRMEKNIPSIVKMKA